jgi:competence protein ComEC
MPVDGLKICTTGVCSSIQFQTDENRQIITIMNPFLQTIIDSVNRLLPEPQSGLLLGIIFGVKTTMSKPLVDALTSTGTLHIVALSGTNITILTNIVGTTLSKFISRRASGLLTLVIIIGFVLFVGPSPSVVRAAIMGSVSLIAVASGRQVWAFWAWCIAVCSMLAIQMDLVANISFQLSSGASLGLILFADEAKPSQYQTQIHPRSISRIIVQAIMDFLRTDVRTTLAAQVFTIPIILITFHRISLISPLPNMLIGWVLPMLTTIGLVTAVLAVTIPPLGQLVAWVAWVPLTYVLVVIEQTAKIPFASIGL